MIKTTKVPTRIQGEFKLIEYFKKKRGSIPDKRVILDIGDDCAAIQESREKYLLVTTDMLLEGVHFSRLYASLRQIGQKALIVNISDIAAMGGEPKFAFISLAFPSSLSLEDFDELADGLIEVAQRYSILILGGDTNASPLTPDPSCARKITKVNVQGMVVNITLLGEIRPDRLITRQGAKPGDLILLTGQVGESAAGLDLLRLLKEPTGLSLKHIKEEDKYQQTIQRHLVPVVRLAESQLISQNHLATAMIDVSDGLAGDLRHLCQPNNLGAILWLDRIPTTDIVKEVANLLQKPIINYTLSGGEDYELLFTCPPDRVETAKDLITKSTGTPIGVIGEITKEGEKIQFQDSHGHPVKTQITGFDHFLI